MQTSDGILIIDKPEGPSSARMVARVKKLMGAKKAGHAGTLDPFATGVMVCCINQATRLSRFFLHSDKSYEAVLRLGIETDTQDRTGTIISENPHTACSEEKIAETFADFCGNISQVPPAYSALKHKGTPLYKLARKGKMVLKPAREVTISEIKILEINLPEIRFSVSCSGGTYIRTLASDIGKILGCGAHLTELRRTKSGYFSIENAVNLTELEALAAEDKAAFMVSMTDALKDMPLHMADSTLAKIIRHGGTIDSHKIDSHEIPRPKTKDGFIRVIDSQRQLLAVLNYKKETGAYDYCCVFNQNMNRKII